MVQTGTACSGGAAVPGARASGAVPELLAPAGTLDALAAAVAAGADAVYMGTGAFDARAASPGTAPEDVGAAAAFAHAHGVRLYVTLNALLVQDELDRAVDRALSVVDAGADALIVADPGLARAVLGERPAAELHLSTQAGAQSAEAVGIAARDLGFKRVTCARELSVPEIAELVATGVEIEAFCHGAICISYSGACSFSALRRGRSAMRGDCTQPCRLSYRLEDGRGAALSDGRADKLLCPRDYLGLRHLGELSRIGVSSLKIEGRMKGPDYVYCVVGAYRCALDALARGRGADLDGLERRVGLAFNRGFTDGYLTGSTGAGLMSPERSCNQGLAVGTLVERRRGEVVVDLSCGVGAGDVLEIRSTPGPDAPADVPERWPQVPCPRDARAGERLAVRCKRKVEVGSPVHVVRSARAISDAARAIAPLRGEIGALLGRGDGEGAYRRPPVSRRETPAGVPRVAPRAVGAPRLVRLVRSPADAARALAVPPSADGTPPEAAVAAWVVREDPRLWDGLIERMTVLLDEVARPGDMGFLGELARRARRAIASNIGEVGLARGLGRPFDVAAPIPAWNSPSIGAWGEMGAERVWLAEEVSPEGAAAAIAALGEGAPGVGVLLPGRPRLMTCEHCLLTSEGPCDGACASCRRRSSERFLVDGTGARLPVEVDPLGRTRIFDAAAPDRPSDLGAWGAAGVGFAMVDVPAPPASRPSRPGATSRAVLG